MLLNKQDFKIYADYCQFYLEDETSPHKTEDIWTEETTAQMIAFSERLIAIGTARYAEVPVCFELHDSEPTLDMEKYSRINESSLEAISGKIFLSGCTEPRETARVIELEPATYRVRVLYSNLESVVGDEGEDSYTLQLWKNSK